MMSLAQISSSRAFSGFGFTNKKSSPPPLKNFNRVAKSFDESFLRRLKILHPGPNPPSMSLSWLSLAVEFLSFAHAEARGLISSLDLSGPDDSIARYLDESVKVLDICNSVSSEIERLRHRRLRINFALHLIDLPGKDRESPTPENLRRAGESLADMDSHRSAAAPTGFSKRSSKTTSVDALIRDLAADLGRATGSKLSGVGKIVRRALHAVGLVTVFVSAVIAAALLGSEDELVSVRAPAEFLWADSLNALASAVRTELIRRGGSGRRPAAVLPQEIADLDSRVGRLRDVMDDADGAEREAIRNAARDVGAHMAAFSEGLDGLSNGAGGLFRTVLCNRNTMLVGVCL